jgi:hypothetical protein
MKRPSISTGANMLKAASGQRIKPWFRKVYAHPAAPDSEEPKNAQSRN